MSYKNSVYKGYMIKYHSSKGMLCVIYYEVFSPKGDKIGEVYSVEEAHKLINKHLGENSE